MIIEHETLSDKIILDIGSDLGETTRMLVNALSGKPNAKLIKTDISDHYFAHFNDEFTSKDYPFKFICTSGDKLKGDSRRFN